MKNKKWLYIVIVAVFFAAISIGVKFRISDQISNFNIFVGSIGIFLIAKYDKSEALKKYKKFFYIMAVIIFICGIFSVLSS